MALINLRPWREERKVLRQKQLVSGLGLSALIAALAVLSVGYYFDYQSDRQRLRNQFLQQETAKLDLLIVEIKELKAQRARLLERLQAIHDLQGNRPVIVRNFDELVRVLPDGMFYDSLSRKAEVVTVEGMAGDSLDVSRLMRNLDHSIWFGEPNLSSVNTVQGAKRFSLTVVVTPPKREGEAEQ